MSNINNGPGPAPAADPPPCPNPQCSHEKGILTNLIAQRDGEIRDLDQELQDQRGHFEARLRLQRAEIQQRDNEIERLNALLGRAGRHTKRVCSGYLT